MTVNGSEYGSFAPGGYAAIRRRWNNRDTVSFELNKSLKRIKYSGMHRIEGYDRYSFMYGPLLMTLKGDLTPAEPDAEQSILLDCSVDEFTDGLQQKDNLTFQTKDGKYQFIPYFAFQEGTFTCFPGFEK